MSLGIAEEAPAPPRAIALRLVSLGFCYPDDEWRERFDALLLAARRKRAAAAAGLERLDRAFRAAEPKELAAQHFRLFGPAPACPLELAFHASKQPYAQAREIADMAGFYKAFGVEAQGRADALPAALEFLAYLEVKRAHARLKGWRERHDVARDAAATLRREVLRKSLGAFARQLRVARAPEFYLELAGLCGCLLGGAS